MDKPLKYATHGHCGYLPSRRASPPHDRYQIILLSDRVQCTSLLQHETWAFLSIVNTDDSIDVHVNAPAHQFIDQFPAA